MGHKKKLKSGEKFFFKIRAYVVKKKVKTFTKYSAVKSITVQMSILKCRIYGK